MSERPSALPVEAKAANLRKLAFDVLIRFEKSGNVRLKADSLLAERIGGHSLSVQERGFTQALVMGLLRHWFRLDAWIMQLSGKKLKDLQPAVRVLLRMGLFQLYGLRQVPPYAAIDTTVTLAKSLRQNHKAVQFINALLREAQRRLEHNGFDAPDFDNDPVGALLLEAGWPEAFSKALLDAYSLEAIREMAQAAGGPAPWVVRVNTLKISVDTFISTLMQAGIPAEQTADLAEAVHITDWSGSVQALPGYAEGWFYVQDPASMRVATVLAPEREERILDLCAAPGSKTTHLAALMENTGSITAIEPKANRMQLLQENLNRLGVTNVQTVLADALQWQPETLYDKVLVDAPCSGSGTLRRHPEILLQLKKMDLSDYQTLQTTLLEKGFQCLKPGGTLVYSTCSILPAENSEIIRAFLEKHPDASLCSEQQSLITPLSDGFYVASLQKAAQ